MVFLQSVPSLESTDDVLLSLIDRRAKELANDYYDQVRTRMLNDPQVMSGTVSPAAWDLASRQPEFRTTRALEQHKQALKVFDLIVQGAREHLRAESERLSRDPDVSWGHGNTLSVFTRVV